MTDLLDLVALSLTPSWSWRRAADRLRHGSSPPETLEFVCSKAAPDQASRLRARAAAAIDAARSTGATAVCWGDPAYPAALTAILDPPFVLWVRGMVPALSTPAVAIVGARAASPYACTVAERLAADLTAAGLTIVSGLARGVDAASHRGAITAGGHTVGVLGSGIDVIYPPEHEALAREMEQRGALVTELVPATAPQRRFFPMRNRIISGLSRAVVVIEAGEKSGSLITAHSALEQGRDVLAVPGNVLTGRNRGAHALLRDGATIVETADDVLVELGLKPTSGTGGPMAPPLLLSSCDQPVRARDPVLDCLIPGESSDLDEIAGRSGLSPARLLPRLFELELQGAVVRVGGGRFVRVDRSC